MTKGGIRVLLIICGEEGRLTNAAATEAKRIAGNVLNKRQDIPAVVREDAEANTMHKLTKNWQKIDPEKNPGAYIASMARNALTDLLRTYEKDLEKNDSCRHDPNTKQVTAPVRNSGQTLKERLEIPDLRKLPINQQQIVRDQAFKLRRQGFSYRQIAAEIGVGYFTVARWMIRKNQKDRRGRPRLKK